MTETPSAAEATGATARAPVLHTLDFWYDPISPYAYLAFERLPQALMGLSVRVRHRPLLFAALLKAHGQLGPAEIAGKRDWTYRQVAWLAHHHGVPLDLPSAHPFNPLALLRLVLCTAAPGRPGETNRYATEQVFRHVWRGGLDPLDPERLQALQQVLRSHMAQRGLDWPDPEGPQVRAALRANTDAALAAGLFGVPTLTVGGRAFWGQDALPMLRACLEGDPWFDGPAWDAAQRLPVGVRRA